MGCVLFLCSCLEQVIKINLSCYNFTHDAANINNELHLRLFLSGFVSQADFGSDFSASQTIHFIRKNMCKYSHDGVIRRKIHFDRGVWDWNTTRRVGARMLDPKLDIAAGRAETAVGGFISVIFEGARGAATTVYCLLTRFTVHVIIPAPKFFLFPAPKHDTSPNNTQET